MNLDSKTVGALAFIFTLLAIFYVIWPRWLAITFIIIALILWAIYEFKKEAPKEKAKLKNQKK